MRGSAKPDDLPGLAASAGDRPSQSPPAAGQVLLHPFFASLLALPLDDDTRDRVRELLALHAGERVTFPSEQRLAAARRLEVARSMLALQVPRAAVLSMLVRRFGICKRQARRDVAAALQVGQVAPAIVRAVGQHDDNVIQQPEDTSHASPA